MGNKEILDGLNQAFGHFTNVITSNFDLIDKEVLKNPLLSQSDRDKIIEASAKMKESIKNQDPNKIFESLNTFNK